MLHKFAPRLLPLCALAAALAAPCAFALNPAEKPPDYIASRWDVEEGLPHNSIKQIFQTRDGYLWVGTLQGLARFDGLTFTIFTSHNTPGLLNNQITSLAETRDGSLWIGTSFGLARYQNGRFTSYSHADGLISRNGTINAVCVASDGSLWIGCQDGITRWVDGKFVNDIDTLAYDMHGMRSIFVDRQKSVWLAAGSEALRYQDGKFTRFGRAQGLLGHRLEMLREDAEGRIIAVTQSGLLRLEGERFVPFEQNGALSSARVGTALVDHAGNLWIGSVGGLDRYSGSKVIPYVDRTGKKLGVVDALFEDREGCLWIGTSAGLYRLTDRRAYTLSMKDGVAGMSAMAVTQTRDGAVWISSWADGVNRIQDDDLTHYAPGAPLSHETVTAIYEAPDGAMWLGTRGSSLDRLEGNKVTTFVYQSGVPTSRPVTAMLTDDDGTLLLGISKRGLLQLRDGRIVPVPEAAEFAPETVWTLERTRDGRLLMGTSKGLYERRADRTWHLVAFRGVPEPVIVRALLEEPDGTIWLATEGQGLIRWQNGEARAYDSRVGMVDDTLFSVLDDNLGSLWVGSGRGIARIRKSEFAEIDRGGIPSLNCLTFGRVDGLLSASGLGTGSPSAVRLADGRLMTATDRGVAVIDPHLLQVNSRPPTVVIESVVIDDRPLPPGSAVSIPAGANRLEIRYTALSLVAPQRLRFRYQLEGSDPRWVEAGHGRTAHYTHLAPGHYRFRVLACNNDGVWNEVGATLALTMLPQYYQTLWFRLAAIAILVGALASLVWLRLRQMNRRQETLKRLNTELDQRVRERTGELSRSNEELRQRELLFRLMFEHAPVGISWNRADLGPNYHFNSASCRILDLPAQSLPDHSTLTAMIHPEDAPQQAKMARLIESGQADSYIVEQRYVRKDGSVVWGLLSAAVIRDQQGCIIQDIGILEDITSRKQAELERERLYKQLVEASRQAGMAEVATNVLHNVGNVLNSMNVSLAMVSDRVRKSRIANLAKVAGLLQEHQADWGAYLSSDSKGSQLPDYLTHLAGHLTKEQEEILKELQSMEGNLDHIKEIVAMQQNYSKVSGVVETLPPVELVEDSLRMNTGALARHDVKVVREYAEVSPVVVERHKVLQILVNLIRNAKYALDESGQVDRRLTLRVAHNGGDFVHISVIDNGVGIPPENLTRIFEHGFSTRKEGHGFGLHSGALAAQDMGGTLTVCSEGRGKGATFTLALPIKPNGSNA